MVVLVQTYVEKCKIAYSANDFLSTDPVWKNPWFSTACFSVNFPQTFQQFVFPHSTGVVDNFE